MERSHGIRIARLLRLAAPVAIGRLGVVGMGVVDAVAVGQLAPSQLAQGLSTAGAVLASEAIGAGAWEEARRAGWCALALTLAAMAGCGLGCAVFAHAVARAFSADPAIVAAFAANMGLVALLMIPDGGQGVADALL